MNYRIITLEKIDGLLSQLTKNKIGPVQNTVTSEFFFCFEMHVSEEYFNIPAVLNGFMELSFPYGIHYRFRLMKIGSIDNQRSFFFRPNCLSEKDEEIYNQLEDFILILPDYIFFAMIERCVFLKKFDYKNLYGLQVINELDLDEFHKFGITLMNTPDKFNTSRLTVIRALNPDYFGFDEEQSPQEDIPTQILGIIDFCNKNGYEIKNENKSDFFDIEKNIWYRAFKKHTNFEIGYIRLTIDKIKFPNAFIINVVSTAKQRGISLGDEMINLVRWILRQESNSLELIAILPSNLNFL